MLAFLVRRLFSAVLVLLAVALIDYAMLGDRLGSVFFHLDFGIACSYPGCPPVEKLWARSWIADVSLLVGALIIAVPAGVAAAVFCATHPRSVATRTLETLGLLFYSMPAYLSRQIYVSREGSSSTGSPIEFVAFQKDMSST